MLQEILVAAILMLTAFFVIKQLVKKKAGHCDGCEYTDNCEIKKIKNKHF